MSEHVAGHTSRLLGQKTSLIPTLFRLASRRPECLVLLDTFGLSQLEPIRHGLSHCEVAQRDRVPRPRRRESSPAKLNTPGNAFPKRGQPFLFTLPQRWVGCVKQISIMPLVGFRHDTQVEPGPHVFTARLTEPLNFIGMR